MDLYDKIKYVCLTQKQCFNSCPMESAADCFMSKYPEEWPDRSEIEPAIDKWIEDHPITTRQSELLKIFPKATKMVMDNNEVVVAICPRTVDDTFDKSTCARVSCVTCQKEYWSQEMTEDGFE